MKSGEMDARQALEERYAEREALLTAMAEGLEGAVCEQLQDTAHVDRISFRVKGSDSFLGKVLDRKSDPPYEQPLVEVEDQVAGRILVFFLDDIDLARSAVEKVFSPVEAERRQPDKYNEFDYESFHAIYSFPPQFEPAGWSEIDDMPGTFELQIRTLFQHAYAEPQHDVSYKPTASLERDDRRELAWIAASAWGADQALLRVRQRLDARA